MLHAAIITVPDPASQPRLTPSAKSEHARAVSAVSIVVLAGVVLAVLIILTFGVIASRRRARLAGASRPQSPRSDSDGIVSPWAEAGRRLKVPPASASDQPGEPGRAPRRDTGPGSAPDSPPGSTS